MSQTQDERLGEKSIRINRGKVDSLTLYEITEHELDVLEVGSPSSLYLNFSIFFLSIATSFLVSLLTTDISSSKTFTVFVAVTTVGFSGGVVLLTLWYRSYRSTQEIFKKIRERVPAVTNDSGMDGETDAEGVTKR